MREFELVMWSCFSKPVRIKEIVAENQDAPEDFIEKQIINHLVNTAYYCKQQVTPEREFEAFKAFFNSHFKIFEGRHTEWLLLNEPDLSQLTPKIINQRYEELKAISEAELRFAGRKRERDYNKIVQGLNDEADAEARATLMAKMRKREEDERRAFKRECRREKRGIKTVTNEGETLNSVYPGQETAPYFGEYENHIAA